MKKFEEYFRRIGLDGAYLDRIMEIGNFYDLLYKEEIRYAFVSEYIDKEGRKNYESLWCFSEYSASESKNFLTVFNWDAIAIKDNIAYWYIERDNFDFQRATEKSRLFVRYALENKFEGALKASGVNCETLNEIFQNLIHPNLINK